MMTDEARDEAETRHERAIARAISACTPEGCHNKLCARCNPVGDARHAELSGRVQATRSAARLAQERHDKAVQALDDYEVSLGLPSILR